MKLKWVFYIDLGEIINYMEIEKLFCIYLYGRTQNKPSTQIAKTTIQSNEKLKEIGIGKKRASVETNLQDFMNYIPWF